MMEKNVKIIASYVGIRRNSPRTAKECYEVLRVLIDKEKTLDAGCPVDTIIVHNKNIIPEDDEQDYWEKKALSLLKQVQGSSTKNGIISYFERENGGLSFGAYNHAFLKYKNKYKYWFFTEDDQIIFRDGCYAKAIEQLESDEKIGFVAIVGASNWGGATPWHAHGGVGITSNKILLEVLQNNPCASFPTGHLPFHLEKSYHSQEWLGEIRFTNAIYNLGYTLCNLDMENICVSWGDKGKRSPRMVPWNESMYLKDETNED